MVVVSLVIGIGIFRTPALVAAATGGTALFLGAWVAGGAASLVGALVFAEIGSRCPRAGGAYAVVAHCWHPLVAFLLNWAQALMQGAGAAGVAVIGAEYLLRAAAPGGRSPSGATAIAALLVAGLVGLHALGIRAAARTQVVLSLAKIVLILGLAIAGLASGAHPVDPAAPEAVAGGAPDVPDDTAPVGLLAALVAVFYTYGGYQNTMNLAGDVRDASRRLPLGILGGMAIVTILYLALNASYVRVLGPAGVAGSPLVAADLAHALFGGAGETFIALAIFLSAAGFVNATLLHVPRLYLAMARDGLLPPILGRLDRASQAQGPGLVFFALTALVPLLVLGAFERLLAYVMFTDALSLAVLASCLFVLRRRGEGAAAAWRMPGYPWLPAVFVVLLVSLAGDLLARQTMVALAGAGVVLAGLPLYALMKAGWGGRRDPRA